MGKPCEKCPWMSKDARDIEAISAPEVQDAMKAGQWFCCHVHMGTCYGAELQSIAHAKRTAKHVMAE